MPHEKDLACLPAPPCPARRSRRPKLCRPSTKIFVICWVGAALHLEGAIDPSFAGLKVEYADVLGGAPPAWAPGLPPDLGVDFVIETGDAPMPQPAGAGTGLVLGRWSGLGCRGSARGSLSAYAKGPPGPSHGLGPAGRRRCECVLPCPVY